MDRQLSAMDFRGMLCGALVAACLGTSPAKPLSVTPLPTATPRIQSIPLMGKSVGYKINAKILQRPSSRIDITGAFYIQITTKSRLLQRECVFFINRGSVPAIHVQFLFSWATRQGEHVSDDPLDVYASFLPGGVFAQGKQIAQWPTGPLCRVPHPGDAWKFSVRVTQVNYQDGASWGTAWHHR